MSAESSRRSKLIDVTYQSLHQQLSGYEPATPEEIEDTLEPRLEILKRLRRPFGSPNVESKRKVDSGAVTLRDGFVVHVEAAHKPIVFAISKRFSIDEVEALVLFRSFIYNQPIPEDIYMSSDDFFVQQVVDAFAPFYALERRCLARIPVPLLRADEHELSFFYTSARQLIPLIIPDGPAFVRDAMAEYADKARAPLPDDISGDPKLASKWAKDNLSDQLALLELAFWAMWRFVPHHGPLVALIYQTAYDTDIGSAQQNGTLLLDEESDRLLQDCATVWLLVMIEVLELENFSDDRNLNITSEPSDNAVYTSSPASLKQIHQLVISHGDGRYALVYLAWTIILARLEASLASLESCPPPYVDFFNSLDPRGPRSHSTDQEPIHRQMLQRCLDPGVGLFTFLHALLTTTPLFVTSIAWKTGSGIAEPNQLAYRSVIKDLLITLSELVPVELIPDFDTFVETWVALFGQSESQSVIELCQQFWQYDSVKAPARRAVLDVARARFPVQFKPLLRLLGALTGSGFKKSDPLVGVDYMMSGSAPMDGHASPAQLASFFFDMLPTYTQVLPSSACTGAHALYEKVPERYGSSSKSPGLTYINLRPIKLPGGSILPPRTTGRLLSQDGEDYIIVSWEHEHSGWELLVEVLVDYVRRRRLAPGALPSSTAALNNRRVNPQSMVTLSLEDIGIQLDPEGDPSLVVEALDLLCSVLTDNQTLARQVLSSMKCLDDGDSGDPNLVQLTMLILEDAVSRSAVQARKPPPSHLITSALSLLSTLLTFPESASRVWLFANASTALFDMNRSSGSASAVLAAERALGSYSTTRAILYFVQVLFEEASSTVLIRNERLHAMKERVLLRALRFVHAEIWMEHTGWKYPQLGIRFEVGMMVSTLYGAILDCAPPTSKGPLTSVSHAVFDALVTNATTSSIGPLITVITTHDAVRNRIRASRRFNDLHGLSLVLRSHLRVISMALVYKQRLYASAGPCLLEQVLCAKTGTDGGPFSGGRHQTDPLDVLTGIVGDIRTTDNIGSLEAVRVLYVLCTSLAASQPSAPTIVGHLSDPESAVGGLVRVAYNPYHDLDVRVAVWRFMAVAVEKEPALGHLFVAGRFRTDKAHSGLASGSSENKEETRSALSTAREMLANWQEYWELNPLLLSSVLGFLAAVWERGLEHRVMMQPLRTEAAFWAMLAGVAQEDLSPPPEYNSGALLEATPSDALRSIYHESISTHAYRVFSKALAIRIIALDLGMDPPTATGKTKALESFRSIKAMLKSDEQLTDHIQDGISNVYDPSLPDDFMEKAKTYSPDLTLQMLESRLLVGERELGDNFAFSITLIGHLMRPFLVTQPVTEEEVAAAEDMIHDIFSINLNLSLAHSSTELGRSWQSLLVKVAPFIQGEATSRPLALKLAATVASSVAEEKRSGELMSVSHGVRLDILLALLELAWFSSTDSAKDIEHFMKVVASVHDLVTSEAQPPVDSVRRLLSAPFHRSLLQIIYFCVVQCRSFIRRPELLSADQRITISSMVDVTLVFVIESLRFVFDAARGRLDPELDLDLELLVAVFGQCTRTDINPLTTAWLMRCQETSVLRASLELFVQTDLTGLSSLQLSRSRKQALYAPHILSFHIAFASISTPAERLANEGILVAYSNSSISSAIQSGVVDVALPELPGERSPAHRAYCIMLSVVSGVITALGLQKHFFDAEASGFVQLYGNQVSRALSWTAGDPISLPFVEEMERVVNLFSAIASTAPPQSHRNEATDRVLSAFTSNSLLLLQQLNYALSHPNHLASLVEPVTNEERLQLEKDSREPSARSSAIEIVDPVTRPFLARLVHRLFAVTSNIVCTLIVISGADAVLSGETEDLPTRFALVVPHSKVVLGEPASMGTLLELASGTLDVLSHLVSRPARQALTTPVSTRLSDRPLDVGEAVITMRRNLEAVLFYAVTQLGTWLAKPELLDGAGAGGLGDAEMDDGDTASVSSRDRRGMRRESVALTERMRRGITGEMGSELKAMIEKARGPLEKSREVEGVQESVDVTKVLLKFLTERVIHNS